MNINAFASSFYFFPTHLAIAKKIKRACKPPHGTLLTLTDIALNVNRIKQKVLELQTVVLRGESKPVGNKKINANFLFEGFIASYESFPMKNRDRSCVNEQLCFVSIRGGGCVNSPQ